MGGVTGAQSKQKHSHLFFLFYSLFPKEQCTHCETKYWPELKRGRSPTYFAGPLLIQINMKNYTSYYLWSFMYTFRTY